MQDLPSPTAPVDMLSYTVLAQAEKTGPQGPDFGKASPVGLLVIVAMLVVILALGVLFNRRMKAMIRRREYAEKHDMDPFDIAGIDAAMAADEGLRASEVSDQAWPVVEPEELAGQYGDGTGTDTGADATAGTDGDDTRGGRR